MCYINANNSQYFCISMGLSSGDFKVPITGRHYCSITLTLIVPHWGAGSLSSLLPGLTEAGDGESGTRSGSGKSSSHPLERSLLAPSRLSGKVTSEGSIYTYTEKDSEN